MREYTDKELLDFLQTELERGRYTGRCILRLSTNGRGWRLNETSWDGAVTDVRKAIARGMDELMTDARRER